VDNFLNKTTRSGVLSGLTVRLAQQSFDQSLFSKIDIPDAQKKIYEPRLAAFKKLFPDAWQKSPRLYTSTQWLCGWIKKNAASIGLPSGVPVFDSGPDFIAALVGTATLFPGRLCDRAGSSEGLNLCSPKFLRRRALGQCRRRPRAFGTSRT
jgi:hypothetical protein